MQAQTFVFFGLAGSGKGTQVEFLMDFLKKRDSLECVHVSTGNEYRKLIESGSYAGTLVKESITQGVLQPRFLTDTIFINVLISSLTPIKHLLTDGYPRTVEQSKSLEEMMKFFKRDIIKIIYIKISDEEAIKRNLLRGRHDDTKEGMAKRVEEFNNNVVPSMNYFKGKEGYEIYTINGEQSREDVFKDIIKKLGFS
ncbi:MAG: nucleoside monophosphate kinase [Candidatus Nomurabacteria bacterium]|nr:nucleoside monophosphate kinase [Candidatus Nomurabacteria bacterium]